MTKTKATTQKPTQRRLLGVFARRGVEKMTRREHILRSNGEHVNQLEDLRMRDNQAADVVGGIDTVPLPESPASSLYIGTWPTPENPYVNRMSYTPNPWRYSYNFQRF